MNKEIKFYITPTNTHLHKDFRMELPFINKVFFFDSYYFWDGDVLTDSYENIVNNIKIYLNKCRNKILELNLNEILYIPVDFSDQYYGVFKVFLLGDTDFQFEYGTVKKNKNVSFFEEDNKFGLVLSGQEIEVDFLFKLSKEEVINSFFVVSENNKNGM